jgi:hypothetical protein
MANKYTKKRLASLAIKEIEIKNYAEIPSHQVRMPIMETNK